MTAHDKAVLEAFELVTATVIEARRRVDGINDWPHSISRDGVDTALRITTHLLESSRQDLTTNLVTVLSTLKAVEILDDESYQLMQLGVGLLRVRSAVEKVNEAAQASGYGAALSPAIDLPQMMHAKADFGDLIAKMEEGFAGLERELQDLQQTAQIDGSLTQIGLVNFFANQISLKLDLGQMILRIGDIFNLFELGRVTSGIGRLTARFKNTVMDAASKANAALKTSTSGFANNTKQVIAAMTAVLKRASKQKSEPASVEPPDEKTRMHWEYEAAVSIVLGTPIPNERKPFIEDLSLSAFEDDRLISRLELKDSLLTIHNLAALEDLKNIERLVLDRTVVQDWSPISALRQLKSVELYDSSITDLTPLAGLTQLREIDIGQTDVEDLTALTRLENLKSLEVYATRVQDLEPISKLLQLELLHCSRLQFVSVEPLERLVNLEELDLSYTNVQSLDFLQNLSKLRLLDLTGTGVIDIQVLSQLPNLAYVYLDNTEVTDWSPVDHIDEVDGRPEEWIRKPQT